MPPALHLPCNKCGGQRIPRRPWCRKCTNEHFREYQKGRPRPEKKLYLRRKRAERHPPLMERDRRNAKVYRARFPEKTFARRLLRTAVMRGTLLKPLVCFKCKSAGRIEGHHTDYNKPLQVTWLCVSCHRAEHSALDLQQVINESMGHD
jgi:hypothetical protein